MEQMKKSLIAFMISFVLSIGFTYVSLLARASLLIFETNFSANVTVDHLIGIFVSLAGFAMFFGVFYFLANNGKVQVMKSTVIAILLGTMLGPAIFYLVNIFLYQTLLGVYISLAASSAVTAVFQFFLPALTALMYVELREKKVINKLESST
jgi:hypothetical protein